MRPTEPRRDIVGRLAAIGAKAPAGKAHDEEPPLDQRPGARARILIVEDDFLVADEMAAALNAAGFEIGGIANSADEAIDIARSRRPMLVVMDIRLGAGRDGVDTALELHREQGLRCIFATAHQDYEAVRRAEAASPLGWLQKPYSMASLVALVREAVKKLGS